ncbi:MAG: hypothetical protein AB1416_00285 [Actinomycetota bacterium]
MSSPAPPRPLDPNEDAPPLHALLPQLLLGASELELADRERVAAYLAEVVRTRGGLLHTASLWNAIYFGWDPSAREYVQLPNALVDDLGTVEQGAAVGAVPVGGMVAVRVGDGLEWCEVLYKEGAHPDLDAGLAPARLSGAPAGPPDDDGLVRLRERLVLDFGAFGMTPSRTRLARLRRDARWLDEHGHLIVDARYTPEDAALDDLAFFARHLLTRRRDVLARGPLRLALGADADEGDLEDALEASLLAVEEIARAAPGLRNWRGYLVDEAALAARLDHDPDAPLARADLDWLAAQLGRVPDRERVVYRVISQRLLDFEGAAERMVFASWAEAVCHASLHVADRLAEHAPDGLDDRGVHLRLDDAWQGGGIWRAEQVAARTPLCDLPPLLALGLGHQESQGVVPLLGPAPEPVEEPPDELLPELPEEPAPELLRIEQTLMVFRTTLAPFHVDKGLLLLPPEIAPCLRAAGDLVALRLHYDGERLPLAAELSADGRYFTGLEWPLAVYPGIILTVSLTLGARVLEARTTPREWPLELAGGVYPFVCDEQILARSLGLAAASFGPATLAELLVATLRHRGIAATDGTRRASARALAAAIFGPRPGPPAVALVEAGLQELVRSGVLARDGTTFFLAVVPSRPELPIDRSLIAAWLAENRARRTEMVRYHAVLPHLRHLPDGHEASREKLTEYAAARRNLGMEGVWPAALPPGTTWVDEQTRGRPAASPSTARHTWTRR